MRLQVIIGEKIQSIAETRNRLCERRVYFGKHLPSSLTNVTIVFPIFPIFAPGHDVDSSALKLQSLSSSYDKDIPKFLVSQKYTFICFFLQ